MTSLGYAVRKRLLVTVLFFMAVGAAFWQPVSGAGAQSSPVPLINEPLVPDAAAPGGQGFTLTVNGTGFAPGAVVNWSVSGVTTPLSTTFASSSQVTATVPASSIASAGTASVTVSNPGIGPGSNPAFFAVVNPNASVAFNLLQMPTAANPYGLVAADFNGDGRLDLAVITYNAVGEVYVLLGKGDGTFSSPVAYSTGGQYALSVAVGDFNGDGKPDLAVANFNDGTTGSVGLLLGEGNGTFAPATTSAVAYGPTQLVVADFNGDGKLDVATASLTTSVLLGNGDGTFQTATVLDYEVYALAAGDFNGDGKLDLVGTGSGRTEAFLFAGNGDGSFRAPTSFSTGVPAYGVATADLNADGILDLVVSSETNSLSVLLGNGDGTFKSAASYATGSNSLALAVGDFNGDGEPDLATTDGGSNAVSVLLGNGDGTFQPHLDFPAGSVPYGLAAGDFNSDGLLDLACPSYADSAVSVLLQQGQVSFSPTGLIFPTQLLNTPSAPQTATLTNGGSSAVAIAGIAVTGTNGHYFSETNTCGAALDPSAKCTITVTFEPRAQGARSASVAVRDGGPGGGPTLGVSGTGNATELSPSTVNFGSVPVGATSGPQTVTLTNLGPISLCVANIHVSTGAASNFALVGNSCKQTLASGASCTMTLTFTPSKQGKRNSQLGIGSSGTGTWSTSYVSLTGSGTGAE